MRSSVIIAAVVAAIVGFGSTVAVIIAAARAVGASDAETASWVGSVCLATAVSTAVLSIRYRMPIVAAWSTPGAALIGASTGIRMDQAVGAFLLAAGLILLTALFRPLGRLVERLPTSIAAAMLAGILIQFVIKAFQFAGPVPELVLPMVGLFLVLRLWSPSWAVIFVLAGGTALAAALGQTQPSAFTLAVTMPVFITPAFDPAVLIGLGLPLYLVTMAGQNLPGYAVLRTDGYEPPTNAILAVTGLASAATAPMAAHTTNLAAITAAICTNPEVHPDPAKRWLTGIPYTACYLLLAVFGASMVALFDSFPAALLATVAGLALAAPLTNAAGTALAGDRERFAAVLTLAVTASGLSLGGIGSAFWGLCVGLLVLGLDRMKNGRV